MKSLASWEIRFDLAHKKAEVENYESLMSEASFWDNQKRANEIISKNTQLKNLINTYEHLALSFTELSETCDLLKETYDEEMKAMVQMEYETLEKTFSDFEIRVLLNHDYDKSSAIVELHPGAGGTESQDWVSMLYRMYTRWAEKKGYKVKVLHYLDGDEAGIKSVSFLVEGNLAYGYLKSEKGVHRLVRISPFDASGRRHTSFASLEVMPQFDNEINIEINENEIEVETMRASGAGGQHVNKTDSAVRITHKPTNIVVTCQAERSQLKNKEQALNMLKSKLYQLEIEKQQATLAGIKGEQKAIEWGSQIRSYVFAPYTLVKDLRTNLEEGNVAKVMDGDLDPFIYAYLKANVK